jgi:hypothetical protein
MGGPGQRLLLEPAMYDHEEKCSVEDIEQAKSPQSPGANTSSRILEILSLVTFVIGLCLALGTIYGVVHTRDKSFGTNAVGLGIILLAGMASSAILFLIGLLFAILEYYKTQNWLSTFGIALNSLALIVLVSEIC